MEELVRNLRRGFSLGLLVAAGLSLWITVLRLTMGSALFDAAGQSYSRAVLLYFLGFSIGGLFVGVLLPLRRWALGSMLLGILFTFPVYATFSLARTEVDARAESWQWPGIVIVSIVVGGALGLWNWSNERKGASNPR